MLFCRSRRLFISLVSKSFWPQNHFGPRAQNNFDFFSSKTILVTHPKIILILLSFKTILASCLKIILELFQRLEKKKVKKKMYKMFFIYFTLIICVSLYQPAMS